MISPDGKRVAFAKQEETVQDIWMLETARNVTTKFTFDPGTDGSQVFSRDGSKVYFTSNRTGKYALYQKLANGTGADELILEGESDLFPDGETGDGKHLLYEADGGARTKFDIMAVPVAGDRTPVPVLNSEFSETHASISPDGRWIMYSSDESGRPEVYVQSYPTTGGKWQISTNGGDQALWHPNGKEIIYLGFDRNLFSVPFTAGTSFEAGRPTILFATRLPQTGLADERNNYCIHPDGQRFLLNNLIDEGRSAPIIVVLNWSAELKK
jgi:Tol biopolymer transport system component